LIEKPPCVVCKRIYEKKDEPTPCYDCLPEIRPENRVAIKVWPFVQGQHIVAAGRPISLNLAAVFPVLDAMGIEKEKHMAIVEKLLLMHETTMEALDEKRKK
jgi:hypothetical protein